MARVGILGGGSFGTALACAARRAGHSPVIWAREPEVVDAINRRHENEQFLAGVRLDRAIRAVDDPAAAVKDAELVLMATPSQHARKVAAALAPHLAPRTAVVTCSKGIESGSLALMTEVLAETLPQALVAVLSGPSFARELASNQPCAVALASADLAAAKRIAALLEHARFGVQPTDDVAGVALGGVMKNVAAIAAGAAVGRKLGDNARATLVALGLEEAARLGKARGARAETFLGLSGAGDMMLTASSLASRNTSLGVALGEGRKAAELLAERREVTEGAASAGAVVRLARRHGVSVPVAAAVERMLSRGASADAALLPLLSLHAK